MDRRSVIKGAGIAGALAVGVAPAAGGAYLDMTLAGLFEGGGYGPSVRAARIWARNIMFPDQTIYCHGIECFTTKRHLDNRVSSWRVWQPCMGQPFDFEAEYNFERNCDFLRLQDDYNNVQLTGHVVAPNVYKGKSSGRLTVWLVTDESVASGGLISIRAWCPVTY